MTRLLCALAGMGLAFAASGDTWTVDSGPIDPTHYFGEIVANGMIGITSSPRPFHTQHLVINGAYEPIFRGSPSSTIATLNPLNLIVEVDGSVVDRADQIRHFRQSLDLKRAAFITDFEIDDKAIVRTTLRALRHLPYTALLEVDIEAKQRISISPLSQIDASSSFERPYELTNLQGFFQQVEIYGGAPRRAQRVIKLAAVDAEVPSGAITLAAAHAYIFDEEARFAPQVMREEAGLTFTKELAAGERYHFALVGSTMTSVHVHDPLSETQRLTSGAVVQGTRALIAGHEIGWDELWTSDIVLEGDERLQRAVRSMLYHLYYNIRADIPNSIAPMGLSRARTGYMGHVFWDAETWMLPVLLALHPQLARAMLDYRFVRLEAAKRNAAAQGFRGAKFPWESAATGEEDIWSNNLNGSAQVHVTADVALGAWNYFRVTQDRDWLREKGYPILRATADFWASRVTRNGPGHYDVLHVTGPDEYNEDVDNDAFTNAAAKANLAAAISAAQLLGVAPDPDWAVVHANIPILKFPNGVTRQFNNYQGEQSKQADVVLLAYPLQEVSDPTAIRRDLDYYWPRFDAVEGPAMTKSIFAILYQRLGMYDKALEIFRSGYESLERPPFGALAESAQSENTYFVTAPGGLLQVMLYGFGGLYITDQGLANGPTTLPPAWQVLTLKGIGPKQETFTIGRVDACM